jgi:hypothetical protein
MTLRLGTYKTTEEYRKNLQRGGVHLASWVHDVLGRERFKTSAERFDVPVTRVWASQLGLPRGGTYVTICEAAKRQGLALCPAEIGPALRLTYTDQPVGETLCIAMPAVADSTGASGIFVLGRDLQELWLAGEDGRPDRVWPGNWAFVFGVR